MSKVNDHGADRRGTVRMEGLDKGAFVERLQTILAQWPSADRLAREMKVSPSAFRKWLKGEAEPSRERLVARAHTAGVGIAWLAQGEGAAPTFGPPNGTPQGKALGNLETQVDWTRFVLVRKEPKAVSAGSGMAAALENGPFIALRQDWVRSECGVEPENLRLEIAVGESMMPTIKDGATLLIDTTEPALRGFGIYVLEVDGERVVKRVQRKYDGSLVLTTDNVVYQPDLVPAGEAANVTVVGRVVWIGGAV